MKSNEMKGNEMKLNKLAYYKIGRKSKAAALHS